MSTVTTNGEGSASPAPPAQAHRADNGAEYPVLPPWYATMAEHGRYDYPGYPAPPKLVPQPVQIEARTVTGLPWYMHVAFAFWAMFTCGYGIKHWVRAWSKAKRVSRTRSV